MPLRSAASAPISMGPASKKRGRNDASSNNDSNSNSTTKATSKQLLANKAFGQNFLKNPGILDKIMDSADVKTSDVVFEIGPGTGNLTSRLLKMAKTVVAQEIDPRMVAEVQKRAQREGHPPHKLIVRQGDCLRADWPPFQCCVANLPYQISSPFTFKLLAHRAVCKWKCAVIMFQKEFAERLVAQPGEGFYGRLALNCALFAKVTRVCKVDRNSFTPPPKVDSMVVRFTPHEQPVDVDFREFDGLMRIVMSRKHKTLKASFKNKSVLKTLENNFRTFCKLKSIGNAEELVVEELKSWREKRRIIRAEKAERKRIAKENGEEVSDDDEDEDEDEGKEENNDEDELSSDPDDRMNIAGVIKRRKIEPEEEEITLSDVELPGDKESSSISGGTGDSCVDGSDDTMDIMDSSTSSTDLNSTGNSLLTKKQAKKNLSNIVNLNNPQYFKKLFKLYIFSVLEQCELHDHRAITLDLNEYLQLLLAFNRKGIHFSNMTEGKRGKHKVTKKEGEGEGDDANTAALLELGMMDMEEK